MNEIDYKTAYENVMIANRMLEIENKQLKNKIDKAIEYIKHAQNYGLGTVRNPYVNGEDLLEILGDKENEN